MDNSRQDYSDFMINIPAEGVPDQILLVRTEQHRGDSFGICVVCPSALSVLTENNTEVNTSLSVQSSSYLTG